MDTYTLAAPNSRIIECREHTLGPDKCWICDYECSPEDNFCRNCGTELTHQTGGEEKLRWPNVDHHLSVGIFLVTFGGITAALSFIIRVTPTVALGLAALLIGIMTLYLPEPTNRLAERLVSDSSVPALLNVENLLDDLSLNEKGIYIPVAGLGVCPKVFVPLTQTPLTRKPPRDLNNSRRIFITLDEKTREGGLLLEVPGRNLLSDLERSLKLDFAKVEVSDLREKLDSGLKLLGISRSLMLDRPDEQTFMFQVELDALGGLELGLSSLTPHVVDQIGTPVSSAIAAAISKSLGEYVFFRHVSINANNMEITATLELVR